MELMLSEKGSAFPISEIEFLISEIEFPISEIEFLICEIEFPIS